MNRNRLFLILFILGAFLFIYLSYYFNTSISETESADSIKQALSL